MGRGEERTQDHYTKIKVEPPHLSRTRTSVRLRNEMERLGAKGTSVYSCYSNHKPPYFVPYVRVDIDLKIRRETSWMQNGPFGNKFRIETVTDRYTGTHLLSLSHESKE